MGSRRQDLETSHAYMLYHTSDAVLKDKADNRGHCLPSDPGGTAKLVKSS